MRRLNVANTHLPLEAQDTSTLLRMSELFGDYVSLYQRKHTPNNHFSRSSIYQQDCYTSKFFQATFFVLDKICHIHGHFGNFCIVELLNIT